MRTRYLLAVAAGVATLGLGAGVADAQTDDGTTTSVETVTDDTATDTTETGTADTGTADATTGTSTADDSGNAERSGRGGHGEGDCDDQRAADAG